MNSSLNNIIKLNKNKIVFILGATGTGKSHSEKQDVTHYLLGEIHPDSDFTAEDFCDQAILYIEKIISRGYVSIIIDVDVSTLAPFLRKGVDHMLQAGQVDEVREIFSPEADYSKEIRRSIGVPEMNKYFIEENKFDACEESMKNMLLEYAIEEIKVNTCNLVCCQHEKMQRFMNEKM
ncbi:hypothetical protein P3S67_011062 [Capsicum chacoense]